MHGAAAVAIRLGILAASSGIIVTGIVFAAQGEDTAPAGRGATPRALNTPEDPVPTATALVAVASTAQVTTPVATAAADTPSTAVPATRPAPPTADGGRTAAPPPPSATEPQPAAAPPNATPTPEAIHDLPK
jgi:hypothetical protein